MTRKTRKTKKKSKNKPKSVNNSSKSNATDSKSSLLQSSLLHASLSDSIFKDSFDKFLGDRDTRRKQLNLKKDVRASFNRDSSLEEYSIRDEVTDDLYPIKLVPNLFRKTICSTPRLKINNSFQIHDVNVPDFTSNDQSDENNSSDLFASYVLFENRVNGSHFEHTTNANPAQNETSIYTVSSTGSALSRLDGSVDSAKIRDEETNESICEKLNNLSRQSPSPYSSLYPKIERKSSLNRKSPVLTRIQQLLVDSFSSFDADHPCFEQVQNDCTSFQLESRSDCVTIPERECDILAQMNEDISPDEVRTASQELLTTQSNYRNTNGKIIRRSPRLRNMYVTNSSSNFDSCSSKASDVTSFQTSSNISSGNISSESHDSSLKLTNRSQLSEISSKSQVSCFIISECDQSSTQELSRIKCDKMVQEDSMSVPTQVELVERSTDSNKVGRMLRSFNRQGLISNRTNIANSSWNTSSESQNSIVKHVNESQSLSMNLSEFAGFESQNLNLSNSQLQYDSKTSYDEFEINDERISLSKASTHSKEEELSTEQEDSCQTTIIDATKLELPMVIQTAAEVDDENKSGIANNSNSDTTNSTSPDSNNSISTSFKITDMKRQLMKNESFDFKRPAVHTTTTAATHFQVLSDITNSTKVSNVTTRGRSNRSKQSTAPLSLPSLNKILIQSNECNQLASEEANSMSGNTKSVRFQDPRELRLNNRNNKRSIYVTKRKRYNSNGNVNADLHVIAESDDLSNEDITACELTNVVIRKNVKISEINESDESSSFQQNSVRAENSIQLKSGKWRRPLSLYRRQTLPARAAFILEQTDVESSNQHKVSLPNESHRQTLRHSVSFNLSRDTFADFNETADRRGIRRRRTSVLNPSVIGVGRLIDLEFASAYKARDTVLRKCGQSEPLEFDEIYSESALRKCRKIGEGVYGEVFMNKTDAGCAVVLKIIPIEGSLEINGEPQKKFDEILSEIIIALELSSLRNDREFMTSSFTEVVQVRCVQGRYPEHLIDLWELYRDNYQTENDHPEIFTDDQLYIVLELANGGQDLEAFQFTNALQSKSAFRQTTLALAVAEKKFQFEHRDLHWGNILLSQTDDKFINFKLNGNLIQIPSEGIKVTIIDYTLSRMLYEDIVLYNDLSHDDELFTAHGDYQFDIYRLMKDNLDNDWRRFEPFNNVLWLHYIADKLINGARYKNPKSRKHRSAIDQLMVIRDELTNYKSAVESISNV